MSIWHCWVSTFLKHFPLAGWIDTTINDWMNEWMNECTVHGKDLCLYSQVLAPESKYNNNLQSTDIYLFFLLKEKLNWHSKVSRTSNITVWQKYLKPKVNMSSTATIIYLSSYNNKKKLSNISYRRVYHARKNFKCYDVELTVFFSSKFQLTFYHIRFIRFWECLKSIGYIKSKRFILV